MSNIPCKNCISFAICNAQISDDNPYLDVIDKLIPRCSLIREYAGFESHQLYFSARAEAAREVSKLVKFFRSKKSSVNYTNCHKGLYT